MNYDENDFAADEPEAEAVTAEVEAPAVEDSTEDYVTVATRRGYAFTSSHHEDTINHEGVTVPREVAEAILAESDELDAKVYVVENEED